MNWADRLDARLNNLFDRNELFLRRMVIVSVIMSVIGFMLSIATKMVGFLILSVPLFLIMVGMLFLSAFVLIVTSWF